jgi:hypothetical protein
MASIFFTERLPGISKAEVTWSSDCPGTTIRSRFPKAGTVPSR